MLFSNSKREFNHLKELEERQIHWKKEFKQQTVIYEIILDFNPDDGKKSDSKISSNNYVEPKKELFEGISNI